MAPKIAWREAFALFLCRVRCTTKRLAEWVQRPPDSEWKWLQSSLQFLEQNLVTAVMGIVGSLLGIFLPRMLYLVGLVFVLAFHRFGTVRGKARLSQLAFYLIVSGLTFLAVNRANSLIAQSSNESSSSLARMIASYMPKQAQNQEQSSSAPHSSFQEPLTVTRPKPGRKPNNAPTQLPAVPPSVSPVGPATHPPRYRPDTSDPFAEFDNQQLLDRGKHVSSILHGAIDPVWAIRIREGKDFHATGHLTDGINFRTTVRPLMPELKSYFKEVPTRMEPGVELYTQYEGQLIDKIVWIDGFPPIGDVIERADALDRLNQAFEKSITNQSHKR